ncbi:hypothetical protein [Spirillospora sp. NPDC029432]|uniref:hypothetical protein n=1 Tax=Spirillospora sp. NPDC029432 TaxID=3154599 RepID=UPI0034546AA3
MRSKWVYVIGGAVAVLVIGLVVAGVRGGSESAPRPQGVQAGPSTPNPPETHPTQGEYVPPRPVPTPSATRAPRRVRPSESGPAGRPERRARRECPRRWNEVPFLKRWCERNGYRTR